MKRLFAAVLAASFLGHGSLAQATTPESFVITEHRTSMTRPGTFTASGAMTDAGISIIDAARQEALSSPVVGTGHFTVTFQGALGTLTVQLQTVLTSTDVPWILHEEGRWVVVDGTGAYSGVHGEGDFEATLNFFTGVDATFTGQLH